MMLWVLIVWVCCGSAAWALHPYKDSTNIAIEFVVFCVFVLLGPISLASVIWHEMGRTK